MSVASARDFLDVLEKSQLVPPNRLQKLRDAQEEFADAKSLAVRLVKDSVLTRWQAGALLAGNHKLSIGKYRLLAQVGSGRTGRVYLAKHSEMGRQVALKLLPRRTDASTTNLKQFVDQARAVSALDHPNLIHTFDVDSDGGQFYLIMEHFPGDDLQTLVDKDGPMDYSRSADIVRQAAEGLAHAAEKGLTHGDVRPSSIAVDGLGRVKLLHLGVVELAGPSLKMLDEKDPSTADYAAPEFTGGNATPASDIYSLGCVLYCLLTGRPPFDEGSFEARRAAHQGVPPASIAVKRPDAPSELAKICQKMMAKTPANRIGSASEAASLLAAWLKKNPLPRAQEGTPRKAAPETAAGSSAAPVKNVAEGAAAPAMPTFDFADKRKSKSSAAKGAPASKSAPAAPAAAPSAAAAATAIAQPQPVQKKSKSGAAKPVNKRLLIGLGAGGGVALLAIVGATIAFFAMRGDKAEVAQANPPSQSAAAPEDELGEEGMDEESLDGNLFSSSESETQAASDAADVDPPIAETRTASPAEVAAPAAPSEPASQPAATAAVAPAATEVAANTEAQPPAPTAEASAPDAAAQGQPAAEPVAANTAAPETPPAGDVAVAPTAPAEATPPAEPKAAPAGNAASAEPFADFKEDSVALPPLEEGVASQPVALATVHDDPEAGCFVRLLGGDGAHKGREIFTLEADDPGFRNRSWTLLSGVGESGEKDRAAIGKLTLDEQDRLMFQWTPEAAAQTAANYVRNCLVSINVGTKTKEFALRTPIVVEPPTISLAKANVREQYDVDFAPEPEKLQFEVTSLDLPLPKPTFNPPGATKASAGNIKVLFGEAPNQLLMFEVRTRMPRKFELSVMPYLMAGNQQVRFTPQVLQQAAAAADAQFKQLQLLSTQKQQPEAAKQQIEQLLPQQQAVALAYAELAGKVSEMKDSASIHFRVFYQVGEHKIELLKTGGAPAAAEAPADAKEPKQRRAKAE
jgi:serine/threonine protein kinase